jgi:hypothetical protein
LTFYLVTYVAKVSPEGQLMLRSEDGTAAVKEINVWDDRDLAELHASYTKDGALLLRKLGFQHSTGRPLEWRGEMTVFAPYLVSIEVDLKHELKQKAGPVDFVQRPPKEPAK